MKSIYQKILREDVAPHPIIVAIRQVCANLDSVHNRFESETDPDLIEASIFEMQSLQAKYRYLLRVARNEGITCEEKSHLWNE